MNMMLIYFRMYPTFRYIALQILTKDSVTVFVNAIMYYKVKVHCTVLYCVLYCTTR